MQSKSIISLGRLSRFVPFMMGHADYIPTALRAIRELKTDTGKYNAHSNHNISFSFDTDPERRDLTDRADWLINKVLVSPQELIDSMPQIIGRQYQGQWAIYACAMTAVALCNISRIYPDTKERYLSKVPSFIDLLMSDEVKYYDTMQWREDAIESLDGNKSHMTYLSLLAWVISSYILAGGDRRYTELYKKICSTLARRMEQSHDLNLPSFPNGIVFLPDMLVSLVALRNYARIFDNRYEDLIERWVSNAKKLWLDPKTGLLISQYYRNGRRSPLHGSYAALNCTYLTMVDESFASDQYLLLKKYFLIGAKYQSIREYLHKSLALGFHIDAGPIIEGRSPTGTAFAMGVATYFEDWSVRDGLLKTAELAGKTINKNGMRHYKLAEIMLTGEAITLAMRTMTRYWN